MWESVSHWVEKLHRSLETTQALYKRSVLSADNVAYLRARLANLLASPRRRRTPGAGWLMKRPTIEDTCGTKLPFLKATVALL